MSKGEDYTRDNQKNLDGGNVFERGSRHPRWRGGLSSETRRNRQRNYHKYGIGFVTATNSAASNKMAKIKTDPVVEFLAERSHQLVISHIEGATDTFEILKKLFPASDLNLKELFQKKSLKFTVNRRIYFADLKKGDDGYQLKIVRSKNIAPIKHKKTLMQAVRELQMKKKNKKSLQNSRKKLHKNTIRGLENLKIDSK